MYELFIDPVFQGVLWTVIGLAAKTFCPAVIPFLGAAKKAQNELIELHQEAEETNESILERAVEKGKKEALKALINYADFESGSR